MATIAQNVFNGTNVPIDGSNDESSGYADSLFRAMRPSRAPLTAAEIAMWRERIKQPGWWRPLWAKWTEEFVQRGRGL